MTKMGLSKEVLNYLPAAQIDSIPHDLSKPRHLDVTTTQQRHKDYQTCVGATEIWNASDTDEGRRVAFESFRARGGVVSSGVYEVMQHVMLCNYFNLCSMLSYATC